MLKEGIPLLLKIKVSDAALLDASFMVSYFNFVSRMALSPRVRLEEDASGY